MWNSGIQRNSSNIIKYGDRHPSALQKIKILHSTQILNIVKIVLFISDIQHYIPIKLCKTSGSLHLFKITGKLTSEDIRLNKNYCGTLER